MAQEKILGEGLAPFKLRTFCVGAKHPHALFLKGVGHPHYQRHLRAHNGQVNAFFSGKFYAAVNIFHRKVNTLGNFGHASVSGGTVNFIYLWALGNFPGEHMLTSTRADY